MGLGLGAQDSEDTPARGWQWLGWACGGGPLGGLAGPPLGDRRGPAATGPSGRSMARGLCPVGLGPQVPAGHTVVPVPAADPRDFQIVMFLFDHTGGNFPAAPA